MQSGGNACMRHNAIHSESNICDVRDPGSWVQDPGSRILDPVSWTHDPGSRILDHRSWILDPGSWMSTEWEEHLITLRHMLNPKPPTPYKTGGGTPQEPDTHTHKLRSYEPKRWTRKEKTRKGHLSQRVPSRTRRTCKLWESTLNP